MHPTNILYLQEYTVSASWMAGQVETWLKGLAFWTMKVFLNILSQTTLPDTSSGLDYCSELYIADVNTTV